MGGKENCLPAKMGSFILCAMAFHAGLPADFEWKLIDLHIYHPELDDAEKSHQILYNTTTRVERFALLNILKLMLILFQFAVGKLELFVVERLFSVGGSIFRPTRSRLSDYKLWKDAVS